MHANESRCSGSTTILMLSTACSKNCWSAAITCQDSSKRRGVRSLTCFRTGNEMMDHMGETTPLKDGPGVAGPLPDGRGSVGVPKEGREVVDSPSWVARSSARGRLPSRDRQGAVPLAVLVLLSLASAIAQVPRVWDVREMARLELPLVKPEYSAKHASAEAYYKIPVVEVYKSHPVYRPDHEPPNYLAFLQGQAPELEWDAAKLPQTKAEWIRAGEALFDAPTRIGRIAYGEVDINNPYVHTREWYEAVKPPIGVDGVLPGIRFVIRRKGKLEIGVNACSMCHSRVMPDGFIAAGPA